MYQNYGKYREMAQLNALGKTRSLPFSDEQGFFDCETEDCAYNHEGQCRFYAVHEELPVITEEDGCLSGCCYDDL